MNIFFMGKGGVGKSTSAALTAVYFAHQGFNVLLASFDPAHNQSDIFNRAFTDKAILVMPGLKALEFDQEYWMQQYLKGVYDQINRTYSYLTAFNLEKYFQVIKHSPGLEEYAMISAFKKICGDYGDHDFLLFDMAPTALALKFFNLPTLSLVWIENLLALRQDIIKKRELTTRIKFGKKKIETDKVLKKIQTMQADYQALKSIFEREHQTRINLVLNPDQLSFAESKRILKELADIDIRVAQIIYNKMKPDAACLEIDGLFAHIPRIAFPNADMPLVGIKNIEIFLRQHRKVFERHYNVCKPAT